MQQQNGDKADRHGSTEQESVPGLSAVTSQLVLGLQAAGRNLPWEPLAAVTVGGMALWSDLGLLSYRAEKELWPAHVSKLFHSLTWDTWPQSQF